MQAPLTAVANAAKAVVADDTAESAAPRRKMTRTEVARHAALVRWKKEKPFGARLAALRGLRKKKAGRGKASAKPKMTPEQRAAEKDAERKQNIATVGQALDDADNPAMSSRGLAAMDGIRGGQEPPGTMADGLIKGGFAVRGADGRLRLTSEGRATLTAASRGDTESALDAISRASDRAARQAERDKKKAEQEKKKGGGGGGKKKDKDADKNADKNAERQKNIAIVGQALDEADNPVMSSRGLAALEAAKNGDAPVGTMADGLIKFGFAERGADGRFRLTSEGRATLAAASRGDIEAALDAISRASDRAARQAKRARGKERLVQTPTRQPRQADAVLFTPPRAIKEIGRMSDYQPILDDLTALADELAAAGDAILSEAEVKAGKRHSAADEALVQAIYDAAHDICELAEALGAEEDIESEDDEEDVEEAMGGEVMMMEGKAIAERADAKPEEGLGKYGDVAYADAKNKKYPIDTAAHIRAAWNYINKPENAAKYDADEAATIKRKIVAAWKKKIDPAGPPSAETKSEPESLFVLGDAVKAIDGDRVGGYAVRFGTADEPDISMMRDYFTKSTDFWLDAWSTRPMLYHHAMDADTADVPRIGTWTKAAVDDVGVWLEGQLDRAHKYHTAIKELVRRGVLRLSSDSAPHLVRREAKTSGTHEVVRWPILAASLTPEAAEPRLVPISFKALLAELGNQGIPDDPEAQTDDHERPDAVKVAADRARRLSIELDLLSMETIV